MLRWADNHLLDLKWEEIGEHYGRYRLHVPEGGACLVAVESPGEIPGHCDRQRATQRAKPALPGARQEPKITSRRSRSGRREGNH